MIAASETAPLEWWEHAQLTILAKIVEDDPELSALVARMRKHPEEWRAMREKINARAKASVND